MDSSNDSKVSEQSNNEESRYLDVPDDIRYFDGEQAITDLIDCPKEEIFTLISNRTLTLNDGYMEFVSSDMKEMLKDNVLKVVNNKVMHLKTKLKEQIRNKF
jgi:hypothetical protein